MALLSDQVSGGEMPSHIIVAKQRRRVDDVIHARE
jgi:hypothetical protein